MKKKEQFDGFGISLTACGPIYYYFDIKRVSMEDFINLEYRAFACAKQKQHRLFKLYDTDHCGYTTLGLN